MRDGLAAYTIFFLNGNDKENPYPLAHYKMRITILDTPAWEVQELDDMFMELFNTLVSKPTEYNARYALSELSSFKIRYNNGYLVNADFHDIEKMDDVCEYIAEEADSIKDLERLLRMIDKFEKEYISRLMGLNAYHGSPIVAIKLRRAINRSIEDRKEDSIWSYV